MESLRLKGTDDTPEVILDKDDNEFRFSGKSLPEDVREFYTPVLEWIKEYGNNPNEKTEIEFKMDYFNTASSKQILDILEAFEEIHEAGNDMFVRWYYQEDDDDMHEAGESFFEIVEIPFEIIAYA